MKRFVLIILCVLLCITVCGCAFGDRKFSTEKWIQTEDSQGQQVTVEIDIHYDTGSARPSSFEVFYTVDDIPFYQTIIQ